MRLPCLGMARTSAQALLWKEFFKDPSLWWDRRSDKAGPTHPDFKHKFTKESLWIDNRYNPPWVGEELARRGLTLALDEATEDDICTAFVALLKACTKKKDISRGTKVHDDLLRRGLLRKCSDALVTMYAKCGELVKAKELFDMHGSRDVVAWTALISGYVQKGQGLDAFDYFERMKDAGVSPDVVTYTCMLKACGSLKAADKGERIHDEIGKQGLLRDNIFLGNALISMYVKCGALEKAREVHEELPVRDVISWTTLIVVYAEHLDLKQALSCYERMKGEGLSPDAATFICILKACGILGTLHKGEEIHQQIAEQGLLNKDVSLGNALVDMYAKCGALTKARQVFEKLPVQDVVSWTTLIVGHTECSEGEEALACFEKMQRVGISPNAVTFSCALKACAITRAVDKGERIHDLIATEQGLLQRDTVLCTALVDMYAKCAAFAKAQLVLEELPSGSISFWNALIAGFVEHGEGTQALDCAEQMKHEGLFPDAVTYTCLLKACGLIGATDKGAMIHDEVAKKGLLGKDVVLSHALVNMYAKCGALQKARQVLEELPSRDAISWTALISGCAEHGEGGQALECFEQMQHEGFSPILEALICALKACGSINAVDEGERLHRDLAKQGLLGRHTVLSNAVVEMYSKCGALTKARIMLLELPIWSVSAWNALIAGYAEQGDGAQALTCYDRMVGEGLLPNAITFACVLKACGSIGDFERGKKIHDEIAKQGLLGNDIVLGNALVDMYVKLGALMRAQWVLEELSVRDVISWTTLITGFVDNGEGEQALKCYEQMRQEGQPPNVVTLASILKACGMVGSIGEGKRIHDEIAKQGLLVDNIVLGNALVDMYAKCGALAKARRVLHEELPARDVVSWNALITGYAEHGENEEALTCLEEMRHEGLSPDAVTFACVLKVCGSLGAVDKGEEVHDEIAKEGLLLKDGVLGVALVDMYAKCGALAKARQVLLDEVPIQSVLSWNALLTGYVQRCEYGHALDCFQEMQHEGLHPDATTFSCVLSACSRLGRVEDALTYFSNMSTKYGVNQDAEHSTCIVDLLGRAGQLSGAVGVIEKMASPGGVVWSALLGACRKWEDVEVGRWAFEHAVQVDKYDAAAYVLMSEIYAAAGMRKDAEDVEAMMIENKAWKKAGSSGWANLSDTSGKIIVRGNMQAHKSMTCIRTLPTKIHNNFQTCITCV